MRILATDRAQLSRRAASPRSVRSSRMPRRTRSGPPARPHSASRLSTRRRRPRRPERLGARPRLHRRSGFRRPAPTWAEATIKSPRNAARTSAEHGLLETLRHDQEPHHRPESDPQVATVSAARRGLRANAVRANGPAATRRLSQSMACDERICTSGRASNAARTRMPAVAASPHAGEPVTFCRRMAPTLHASSRARVSQTTRAPARGPSAPLPRRVSLGFDRAAARRVSRRPGAPSRDRG